MGKPSKSAATPAVSEVIALPADCRIGEASALRERLLAALDGPPVILDACAVNRWDSAALQVLLAFRRAAAERGAPALWRGVGDNLREAAGVLGLATILELPAATPA